MRVMLNRTSLDGRIDGWSEKQEGQYARILTIPSYRPFASTTSPQMSKKQNSTIEQPYSRHASPTRPTASAAAWIRLSESKSHLYMHPLRPVNTSRPAYRLELETEKVNHLGQHSDAISSMCWAREQSAFPSLTHPFPHPSCRARTDALVTGSWDRTVRFWDPRAASPEQASHRLPERAYHTDLVNNVLVVAMASRLFHIYDVRKMDAPAQTRESSLKFMTRALACMGDGSGACSASARVIE